MLKPVLTLIMFCALLNAGTAIAGEQSSHNSSPKHTQAKPTRVGTLTPASNSAFQYYVNASVGFFANDSFWDGKDRWRTGSYQRSIFLDYEKYEFRLRMEFVAPQSLTTPDKKHDRPYAAIFSLGLFDHQRVGQHHFAYGIGVDAINKSKFAENYQKWWHSWSGFEDLNIADFRVPSQFAPLAEASWQYEAKLPHGYAIPFVEIGTGPRDYARAGLDLILTDRELHFLSRDATTGNLLFDTLNPKRYNQWNFDMILGADYSYVAKDIYIENDVSNVKSLKDRYRLRLALRGQVEGLTFLVGPTYLSPEFDEQSEGQILQTFSLELNF